MNSIKQKSLFKKSYNKEKVRNRSKKVCKKMVNTIRTSGEDDRLDDNAYKKYTNLTYLVIFGKKAEGLRNKFQIKNIRDYLKNNDLEKLKMIIETEKKMIQHLDSGLKYKEIKEKMMVTKNKLVA